MTSGQSPYGENPELKASSSQGSVTEGVSGLASGSTAPIRPQVSSPGEVGQLRQKLSQVGQPQQSSRIAMVEQNPDEVKSQRSSSSDSGRGKAPEVVAQALQSQSSQQAGQAQAQALQPSQGSSLPGYRGVGTNILKDFTLSKISDMIGLLDKDTKIIDMSSLGVTLTYEARSIKTKVKYDLEDIKICVEAIRQSSMPDPRRLANGFLMQIGFKALDCILFEMNPDLFTNKSNANISVIFDGTAYGFRDSSKATTTKIYPSSKPDIAFMAGFFQYLVSGDPGKTENKGNTPAIVATILNQCRNEYYSTSPITSDTAVGTAISTLTDHMSGILIDYTVDDAIAKIQLSSEVINRLRLNVAGHRFIKMIEVCLLYPGNPDYKKMTNYAAVYSNRRFKDAELILEHLYTNFSPGVIYKEIFTAFRHVDYGPAVDGTVFPELLLSLLIYLGFNIKAAHDNNKKLFTTAATTKSGTSFSTINLAWKNLDRIRTNTTAHLPWTIIPGNNQKIRSKTDLENFRKILSENYKHAEIAASRLNCGVFG